MSARKKPATTAPAPDGAADAPPKPPSAAEAVRVRLKAGGPQRRYRAGMAFVRQHVDLEVPPAVLEALKADDWLEVEVLQ